MPGIVDDIIIKKKVLAGLFDAAEHLCPQIKANNMLPECQDLDDKLREAYLPFRDTFLEVIDQLEARLTAKAIPVRKP